MSTAARRLHDARLAAAIDNACTKLPDGFTVSVVLSQSGGDVVLCDDDDEAIEFPSNHETLASTINDAVEFACTSHSTPSAKDQ
jgi:hypothetical protein